MNVLFGSFHTRRALLHLRFLLFVTAVFVLFTMFHTTTLNADGPVGRLFVVNSTVDHADALPGDNLCADPQGLCTLRAALEEANAVWGEDTIHFHIPGSGPHTIYPQSAWPLIIDNLVIDGYTQPGAVPNSNPAPQGLNTQLMIVLDGSQAGDTSAFYLGTSDYGVDHLVIRGLVINNFSRLAIGTFYEETLDFANVHIAGNFIGTDVTGTIAQGNGAGVWLSGHLHHDYLIGGTDAASRNLISGNGTGVAIVGRYPLDNTMQGNLIGTDVTGTSPLGNVTGVFVGDVSNTMIGGLEATAVNVISGNGGAGIYIAGDDGSGNIIQNNLIGTDFSGEQPVGNGGSGIDIDNQGVTILSNRIAFNAQDGVTAPSPFYFPLMHKNSIFANGGLGIDLGAEGVSEEQPLPQLTAVTYTPPGTYIAVAVHTVANHAITVELYANHDCDPSGYGEGEIFLQSIDLATDADGNTAFALTLRLPGDAPFVTARSLTSEFSACAADPLQLLDLLMADVQQLINEGTLSSQTGGKLLQKLTAIKAELQSGQENTAVHHLRDFISTIRTLMNRRQLPYGQGQALIDAAWLIIRQIG